jgi:hypothetical protein
MKSFVIRTFWEALAMTGLILMVMLGLIFSSGYLPYSDPDEEAIDDSTTFLASSDIEPSLVERK